jgi:hypothetical protein
VITLADSRTLSLPLPLIGQIGQAQGMLSESQILLLRHPARIERVRWPDLDEDIELTRLFEGGKSIESERSIQRWLQLQKENNQLRLAAD